MPPDEPTNEEKLEQLPEDYDTPFKPAASRADDSYPAFDAEQDPDELYQKGRTLDEPNAGNTVKGYDPRKDQRLK